MKQKLLVLMVLLFTAAHAQLSVEGFEGPFPPQGWLVLDNGIGTGESWEQTVQGNPTQPPYMGDYTAFLNNEDVPDGTFAEDWLVTPNVTIPANGQLSFYSRLTINGNQGNIYKIMLTTGDPQDMSNYTLLQQWTEEEINPESAVYTHKVVDIPSIYAGQDVHLAFVMINDDGDRWFIDNVSIVQGCPAPVNLTVTNIGETSFDVSWTAQGSSSQWEVVILPADEPFTGNEAGVISSSTIYTVTGLTPGSAYQVCVRALCEGGNASIWTDPIFIGISTGNALNGHVTFDADGDTACEAADTVSFMPIAVSINGVYAFTTYTDMNGEYHVYNLPDGESTVTLQPATPAIFPPVDAVNANVNFTETNDTETADICLTQPEELFDLSVTLTPVGDARPGLNAYYKLTVANHGSVTGYNLSAAVTFDDERQNYVSADGDSAIIGSTITFDVGTLQPFSTQTYNIVLYTEMPPVNVGGEVLEFTSALNVSAGDATPLDNTATLYQTIINSWDPNDITVHEGPEIILDQADGYLTYTIRFENIGTAPALDIRVSNQLDEKFKWDTFQPVSASHTYSVQRSDDMVQFFFNDINLQPTDDTGTGEHGYITYRIMPKDNVVLGDIFYNFADIFFDFNESITTNIAMTEIVQEVNGLTENNLHKIQLYPNPVSNSLYIDTAGEEIISVMIYDLNGRKCLSGNSNTIDVSALGSGLYVAAVNTAKETSTFKLVKQ